MQNDILDQHELYFPQLQEQITLLKLYFQEKQWHQLMGEILKYINAPEFQNKQVLLEIYDGFVKNFESKVDQIKLMQFVMKASNEFKGQNLQKFCYQQNILDGNQSIEFITKIKNNVLNDDQAIILYELKKVEHLLQLNQKEGIVETLKNTNKNLDSKNNVDPFVYSSLHRIYAIYYKQRQDYENFYHQSLQYLAYTQESVFILSIISKIYHFVNQTQLQSLGKQQKIQISFDMAIAILISNKIYNFSELLEQPIIQSLQDSQYEWIYQLLQTFNKGNVTVFKQNLDSFKYQIQQNELLKNNLKILEEKIRIMSFLELVFTLPKNDRTLTFAQLAHTTQFNENEIEHLIMRAQSLEQVKGSIDQINRKVKITWIVPRVLDRERIGVMTNKINDWTKSLNNLLNELENQNAVASN